MTKLTKRNVLLVILSFVLILPNFLTQHLISEPNRGYNWEEYDSSLANHFLTIEEIISYADSVAAKKGINNSSIEYGEIYAGLIRKRFHHGYSHYALNENWLAALAGRFVWDDLSAIVLPEDLIKKPMAACSQQSIVMMECFKRKGIPYRKVGFDHHYTLEGNFGGKWYFFDTNMEPDFSKYKRTSIEELIREGALEKIYGSHFDSLSKLKWTLSNYYEGATNVEPAPKAMAFHKITFWLSRLLFLFPLLFLFIKRKKHKNISVAKKHESSVPVL